MVMPLLSVITACYNHADYLAQSMRSVLDGSNPNLELIVVIDASPDDSEQLARRIADLDSLERVTVIVNEANRGLAASQNIGIEMARAPWVLKVDADDYISPTYVEEILAAAEQDPRRNVIFSPAHEFGNGKDSVYRYPAFDAARMIDDLMIPGPAAFRRELWDAVGGYDESMRSAEDWDLYIRAQLTVGLVPHQLREARWHYRHHPGVRASAHGMQRLPFLKKYWREHTRDSVLTRTRTWGAWCAVRGVAA